MQLLQSAKIALVGLSCSGFGQTLANDKDASLSALTPPKSITRPLEPSPAPTTTAAAHNLTHAPAAPFGKPNLFGIHRYTEEQKAYIKSLPIEERPQRIGHPVGRIERFKLGIPLFPGTAVDFRERDRVIER